MKIKDKSNDVGWIFPMLLIILFIALIGLSVPEGCLYGSSTDWYCQHVTLAETIRSACLEQKTLAPPWLPLGGGSNGYQFAYYGYFRPDILIGCLMPKVSMAVIIPAYALAGYLLSVLLFYGWLREEDLTPFFAFFGGVLFMTAGCFFQTHRQIMFINYMPFLLLALIFLKKKRYALVCISLFLIYLHSFYYAIACLAVVAWYWYRLEGKGFLKRYLVTVSLSVGMAMMLLLPSFLVILEHRHSGQRETTAADLFWPNAQNLLYSPYGMGVTVLSLYLLLVGLEHLKYRKSSICFLAVSMFGVVSWILNGTLYARGKILIPFVPLLILFNMTIMRDIYHGNIKWRLWPFVILFPAVFTQWGQETYNWVTADVSILFAVVLGLKLIRSSKKKRPYLVCGQYLILLLMPVFIFFRIAEGESWIRQPAQQAFSKQELAQCQTDPMYRFDSISDAVNECNALDFTGQQKSTMYSSVTNRDYQDLYYELLCTPIQINNRTALLAEENPFLEHLLGIRYLLTTKEKVPDGYAVIQQKGDTVIAENPSVLPIAYVTSDCMGQQQFQQLDHMQKLEAISKYTIVDEAEGVEWEMENDAVSQEILGDYLSRISDSELPSGIQIEKIEGGYHLTVKKRSTITWKLDHVVSDILLLRFQVKSRDDAAVVITVNDVKNKLSGSTAPYPNENDCFSYPLSEPEGIAQITVKLSKGSYEITNIQANLFPIDIFEKKEIRQIQPVTGKMDSHAILFCSADCAEDEYFVTSIPLQRGMHLFVDGEETQIETVNGTFAGVKLEEGVHEVELKFFPPGQRVGYGISLLSGIALLGSIGWKRRKHR